ncbi:MAG TPA: T9SS type A sorting domain-containing protein, partial [Bacteroidia bacterium]|nr:T9SS type A sorting domain-containing protein [Bacteroidia bacterium]
VDGFKIQFWLFPSETSCGQLNSWGSCVGNAAFLDFSTNGGTSWSQILQMDLSSTGTDMCFNNTSNTKWLTESAWSRVCLTVFRSNTSAGNFYTAATGSTAASGIMVNSAFFTSAFKFRIRYSQTASCTAGITATNPGRYLAIDFPVITSGNQLIPCGISFANMCGYGSDANDDGVGSSSLTSFTTAYGTVRRGVNQAERGVEILTSQNASHASQNLSGSTFATNHDLCNAEGGDKQCIDWRTNNNFHTVVYECIADWEASSGTGINVQYYEGTTPQSVGMTKVTSVGRTALLGWRYSANRFVSCGSLSDLNPGCNGYYFLSGSLPTQFGRGFYALSHNSTGQSWTYYGASSCNHYFNGPFFAPIAVPDTLTGSGNYTICVSGNLVFTGLSSFCSDASGFPGSGTLTVTGPGGFNEVIVSGGQGSTPIVDPGVYVVTANTPTSPTQCLNCARRVCITVSPADLSGCGIVAYPGLTFWANAVGANGVQVSWNMQRDGDAEAYTVERKFPGGDWSALAEVAHVQGQQDYGYADRSAWGGLRNYRLKLQKPDGDVAYSDAIEVRLPMERRVQVAPNPASERMQVRVGMDVKGFSVQLFDLAGRALRSWEVEGVAGELSLGGLAKGVYLLRVLVAGEVEVLRIGVE